MDAKTLDRLNRIFADKRGKNEFGEPIYRWFRSPQLTYPLKQDDEWVERGGLYIPQATGYTWEPQIDEDRWVVAQWRREDPETWLAQFGTEVPWPQRGLYYATNLMLNEGMEPCDATTNYFADLIARQAPKSIKEVYNALKEAHEQREAANKAYIADWVDDCVPAFLNPEPGKRGGSVSFGGL